MPYLPSPPDWPRLSTSLFYRDAAAAIDWLCRAFGFEVRLKIEGDNGRIIHSELTYGEALIMVCEEGVDEGGQGWRTTMRSPASLGGANSQSIMLYVDDADAHCDRARASGAEIIDEPKLHDYGEEYWADRSYGVRDPDGHIWWISQRVRTR